MKKAVKKAGKREFKVVVQKWEESEKNWGTRPDGYSLHLTDADRKSFIDEYWRGMPDDIQDEYSRPDGTPYEGVVSAKIYAGVKASKNGVRHVGSPPRPGGVDGWVSLL